MKSFDLNLFRKVIVVLVIICLAIGSFYLNKNFKIGRASCRERV